MTTGNETYQQCILRHAAALTKAGVEASVHNVAMRSGYGMWIVRKVLTEAK